MCEVKRRECERCKEYWEDSMMYDIETPNLIINLCLDCAIEIEDDLRNLVIKHTHKTEKSEEDNDE